MFFHTTVHESSPPPSDANLVSIIRGLNRRFASLLKVVFGELQMQEVRVDALKIFLTQLYAACKENAPELDSTEQQLATHNIVTIDDVMAQFSKAGAWDFLNFSLLNELIEEYKCSNSKEAIDEYQKEINQFKSSTKLKDFLRAWSGRASLAYMEQSGKKATVMVKVEESWSEFTLEQVAQSQMYLADEFRLRQFVFTLANATHGCVRLMWFVSPSVAAEMRKVLQERKPDLIKGGILQLAIDGRILYEVHMHVHLMVIGIRYLLVCSSFLVYQ